MCFALVQRKLKIKKKKNIMWFTVCDWFLPSWSSPFLNRFAVDFSTHTGLLYIYINFDREICVTAQIVYLEVCLKYTSLSSNSSAASCLMSCEATSLRKEANQEVKIISSKTPLFLMWHQWTLVIRKLPTTLQPWRPSSESLWETFAQNSIRTSMNMEVKATWGNVFWRAEKRRRRNINTVRK